MKGSIPPMKGTRAYIKAMENCRNLLTVAREHGDILVCHYPGGRDCKIT